MVTPPTWLLYSHNSKRRSVFPFINRLGSGLTRYALFLSVGNCSAPWTATHAVVGGEIPKKEERGKYGRNKQTGISKHQQKEDEM